MVRRSSLNVVPLSSHAFELVLSGIPPGQSYTYEIPMNVSGQWGSYWVHAHATGQYVDGLRAPLIIHRNPDFVTSTGSGKQFIR